MAEEGATFYYSSKQHFNFDQSYDNLRKSGWFLRLSDTNLITFSGSDGECTDEEIKNIKDIIYKDKYSGVNLFYLDSGYRTYWSFSSENDYFSENLTFNYIGCLQIEEKWCEIFTNHAIEIISEIGSQFLGFTLDMYGETETYEFEKIFDDTDTDTFNSSYISDLTFLPKEKMSQFVLEKTTEVIEVNRNFICIAKNKKLAKYLKGLLPI